MLACGSRLPWGLYPTLGRFRHAFIEHRAALIVSFASCFTAVSPSFQQTAARDMVREPSGNLGQVPRAGRAGDGVRMHEHKRARKRVERPIGRIERNPRGANQSNHFHLAAPVGGSGLGGAFVRDAGIHLVTFRFREGDSALEIRKVALIHHCHVAHHPRWRTAAAAREQP